MLTCYSPVRHSTHSRRSGLVRLACVRHAASVRPEPGSNSPIDCLNSSVNEHGLVSRYAFKSRVRKLRFHLYPCSPLTESGLLATYSKEYLGPLEFVSLSWPRPWSVARQLAERALDPNCQKSSAIWWAAHKDRDSIFIRQPAIYWRVARSPLR